VDEVIRMTAEIQRAPIIRVRKYRRVSTEEQAEEGYSLNGQNDRLDAFAFSQGWTVAEDYMDDGYSAKNLDRPAMKRLLAEVRPGEIILVYKLDRLTRSVRDLETLLDLSETKNIYFRSATEMIDTSTANGRMFVRLIINFAQWEREQISERTAFGKKQKVVQGEWQGGPVPFGYRAEPGDKMKRGKLLLQLLPDEKSAHIVLMMFERYLAGYGVRSLCLWLNGELGVRTNDGAMFRQQTVIRILTNPIYCGDVIHGRRTPATVTRKLGAHEALVPRDMFEQVQATFAARKFLPPRQSTGQYPASGIAKCGVCGGRVDIVRKTQARLDGSIMYSYRCFRYQNGLGCGDGTERSLTSASGRIVEDNIVTKIENLRRGEDLERFAAAYQAAKQSKTSTSQAELDRLNEDLADAEFAVRQWDVKFEKGRITEDEHEEKTATHVDRIRSLRAKLAELDIEEIEHTPNFDALATLAVNIREAWQGLTPPERKALLLNFVQSYRSTIFIFPDRTVEIRPTP
jgi:site-specific DNA recombinase